MPIRGTSDDIQGTLTTSGLSTALSITTLNVSTTALKLPATPLVNRNNIMIHNLSTTETLYIGNSNVTADRALGTTAGFEIGPDSFISIDITDDIEIYGRVASGTIKVKVMEFA